MIDTSKFRTKTYRKERKNGDVLEQWLISLDMGYSSVKTVCQNSLTMFPAFAVRQSGDDMIIGNVTDQYIRYTNLRTGEKWLIGKSAENNLSDNDASVSEEALYGRDRYDNEMFRVVMETGLGMSLLGNSISSRMPTQDIFVETGLPPKYYESDKEYLTDALEGEHHFSIQIGNKKTHEFHIQIKREMIHVMKQPMGGFFSLCYDDAKPSKLAQKLLNSEVMILDGGFKTIDVFPYKNHVVRNDTTFPNLGMQEVLSRVCGRIQEMYHASITVPAMQKYLETGEFIQFNRKKRSSERIPFGALLEEESKKVCDEVINSLFEIYQMGEYKYLVLGGGTCRAWADYIRDEFKDMNTLTILDGCMNDDIPSEFANVRGYYYFRYNQMKASKSL